jgi:hypothetical protein
MAHQRQLIREAVRAQLLGKTAAAARVHETRMVPWRQVELPALSVYALSERIDADSQKTAPRELTRTLKLRVVGVVRFKDNIDDALDELALQVERALDADPNFGGTAFDSILSDVELGVDEESGKPLGVLEMTYTVTYHTDAPAAADVAPLADFATAGITTDLSGTTAPGNQAQDVVAVPVT